MARISKDTIDKVFNAANIIDVVGDYVSLKKSGANYKGLCPFHDERTPSFVVFPAKNTCHCFGCRKGGNSINFLMELNGLSYPEAIRQLAQKYNIEIVEEGVNKEEEEQTRFRDSLFAVNKWANDFFQHSLHDTEEGLGIGMNYFRSRDLRDDIIKKFQLGYCPDSGFALADEAKHNHFSEKVLTETGLCIKKENSNRLRDRFRGRVMFPVHSVSGKIVAFGGRVLVKKDNVGKYVNSPESLIYSKSCELYGLFFARQAIHRFDRCFLVEGYTDVISMHQCGIENVVASSGTALTIDQIRLIKRFTQNITVLYDGDNAGIKASLRGIDMLLEQGLKIKVLLLPDGEDPDSFARNNSAEDFVNYINEHQVDFIRFKANLLLKDAGNDVYKRAEVINDIAKSIAYVSDTVTRSIFIKECADITGISEEDINKTVNDIRNKMLIEKQKKELEDQAKKSTTQTSDTASLSQTVTTLKPADKQKHQYIAEVNLMKYIIRYGEQTITQHDEKTGADSKISFAQLISNNLTTNSIKLTQPLFNTIFNEILSNISKPNFKATDYLLSHPDSNIRSYTQSVNNDTESVLGIEDTAITNHLAETAQKLTYDLMIAILKDLINETEKEINSDNLSDEQQLEKLQKLQALKMAQVKFESDKLNLIRH